MCNDQEKRWLLWEPIDWNIKNKWKNRFAEEVVKGSVTTDYITSHKQDQGSHEGWTVKKIYEKAETNPKSLE